MYGNRYQQAGRNQGNQVGQAWVEEGSYEVTTNRFTAGVTYDEAGNVTVDGRFRQRRYEYDANNRQRRSANLNDTGAVRSVYDGAGQRVATVEGGAATWVMVYDAAGELVAEYGGGVSASGTQYVMSDGQGSPRVTMFSAPVNNQLVVARQDYLPFGEDIPGNVGARAGVAGYGQPTNPRQKYTGMEMDEYTGMSHTLWREFDAMSARWTAPDPYGGSMEPGSPQSFNRYTYVNNDPVNKVDPTGLMLSDIGVYQTSNAAVATRLNWAMVTVLRRYMDGQTGKAQQQQRNAAFAQSSSVSAKYANYFGETSGDDAGGANSGDSGAGPSSGGGQREGPGYAEPITRQRRFFKIAVCETHKTQYVDGVPVSDAVVSTEQVGILSDITVVELGWSPEQAPPLGNEKPLYGSKLRGDQRGHILARALGGPPDPVNLFWQKGGINNGPMKSFEYSIRRNLLKHDSWTAMLMIELVYSPPASCTNRGMWRPTGVNYYVWYLDTNRHLKDFAFKSLSN